MNKTLYKFPEQKRVRVIVDSDAACECDDQFAIVHALLSPKVEVRALTAEHYGDLEPATMQKSYDEIKKILNKMGQEDMKVLRGCEQAMVSETCFESSEAVDFIIEEALKADTRPLFILCQGAVTNVASALIKAPEIGKRLTVISVGGMNYPIGDYEFNSWNDMNAFNALMRSEADVWLLPAEVYSTLQTSIEELYMKVAPCGEIGRYLYENMIDGNVHISKMFTAMKPPETPSDYLAFPNGGSWSFGDSCAIGLLLSNNSGQFDLVDAPYLHRDGHYEIKPSPKKIRYYRSVNTRFILEDFFCKLACYCTK